MIDTRLPVLALDIGGTKILAALVISGKIITRDYSLTHAAEGPAAVINNIFHAIDSILAQSERDLSNIRGISIAVAGGIDSKNGLVTLSPNLPGWYDVPLARLVGERYPVDIHLINDANAAAIGEHRYGAGIGKRNIIFLTVSSGIGGGVIINNEIYEGTGGAAGEFGHMTIDFHGPKCPCGNVGCLEMLASGKAMAREVIRLIKEGGHSSLTATVKGEIDAITAREIKIAAEQGDALALAAVDWTATNLGIGLVGIVNIFNPEIIVIGGGVSNFGEMLLAPARKVVLARAFPFSANTVQIVRAGLGEDAGVVGAGEW